MTDVSKWAKRYFREEFPLEADTPAHESFFETGADTLAALLLSDEVVDAGVMALLDADPKQSHEKDVRAVLQAALDKITEGDDTPKR